MQVEQRDHIAISIKISDSFLGSRRVAIMKVMEANGTAESVDGGWQTTVSRLLSLDDEQLDLLGWPPKFPGQLRLEDVGNFKDKDFRFRIRLIGKDGVELIDANLNQGQVMIGQIAYRLTLQQHKMVKAVQEANENPPSGDLSPADVMAHNLKQFKHVKKLAEAASAEVSKFIDAEQVVEPNAIIPVLKPHEDGSAEIIPVPGYRPDDQPDEPAKPVIPPDAIEGFTKRGLNRPDLPYHGTRSGGKPVRVLMEEPVRYGIKELKEKGRLTPDEARMFHKNPGLFLESPVFDLEQYSTRVVDIGSLMFRTNPPPGGGGMSQEWDELVLELDPDVGLLPARQIRVESLDDLQELRTAAQEAVACESNEVEYKGQLYERDDRFIEWLIRTKELELSEEGLAIPEQPDNESDETPKHLLISTNLDSTEFQDGKTPPGMDPPLKPTALLPEINLFPHQLYGLAWLQSVHRGKTGGILADDMGLGKTLQVLSYVIQAIESGAQGPFLVVAPLSVVDVWREEIQIRFSSEVRKRLLVLDSEFFNMPDIRTKKSIVRTKDGEERSVRCNALTEKGLKLIREAGIVVCHYEAVRAYQISLGSIQFEAIICDEAQRIKNPTTLLTNAVKAMQGQRRIVCTATPVENSLVDLWCLTDFARPGLLESQKEFEKKYAAKPGETIPEDYLTELKSKFDEEKLLLRRTKEEQLPDLPTKKEEPKALPLSPRQLSLYGRYVRIAADEPRQTLGVLISLLMLSDHPALVSRSELTMRNVIDLIEESPKLSQTLDWLRDIQEKGEKVLIFTRLKRMQMILQITIEDQFGSGIVAGILNGDTPVAGRKKKVQHFQHTEGFSVLILSPDVAGMGLNIVEANHVIHYTRLWNPAKESQATDRVYRIGQTKDVTVYYPMTKSPDDTWKTVEERLHDLLMWKRGLMKHVLTSTGMTTVRAGELKDALSVELPPQEEALSLEQVDLQDRQTVCMLVQILFEREGKLTIPGSDEGLSLVDLVVRSNSDQCTSWVVIHLGNRDARNNTFDERLRRDLEAVGGFDGDVKIITTGAIPEFVRPTGLDVTILNQEDLQRWIEQLNISAIDFVPATASDNEAAAWTDLPPTTYAADTEDHASA